MEGISYIDDVLKVLGIIGDDFSYTINKPGKNPEYGDEINDEKFKGLSFKAKSRAGKNDKMNNLKKTIAFSKADNKEFSKGNLQRRNHGR